MHLSRVQGSVPDWAKAESIVLAKTRLTRINFLIVWNTESTKLTFFTRDARNML